MLIAKVINMHFKLLYLAISNKSFVSGLRQVGRWFSPGPPVSSTNKTDRHDI